MDIYSGAFNLNSQLERSVEPRTAQYLNGAILVNDMERRRGDSFNNHILELAILDDQRSTYRGQALSLVLFTRQQRQY